jgi:NAD+ synthase (glutamine-hydrolysing)
MRIAVAQISPRLGEVGKNISLHLELMEKARREKANLLVFPELSLTGYTLKDLVEELALDPAKDPAFRKILAATRGLTVVLGFVEESHEEKGIFYNSAAAVSGGRILQIHRKVYLPTNGMFEEGKFFATGRDFRTFGTPHGRAGMMICRDFLHYGASYVLFAGGADLIVVISAAPGRGVSRRGAFETSRMWELMGETVSYFSTAFVVYANRVGFEEGVSFAGGSFLYGPGGKLLARAAYLEPEFLVHDIDPGAVREARRKWLFKRDEKPEVIWRSLERLIRESRD